MCVFFMECICTIHLCVIVNGNATNLLVLGYLECINNAELSWQTQSGCGVYVKSTYMLRILLNRILFMHQIIYIYIGSRERVTIRNDFIFGKKKLIKIYFVIFQRKRASISLYYVSNKYCRFI